jgi:transposase
MKRFIEGADPATIGRPGYHPSVLLKLYIYGYLNRIQSSRRLERETQRNVELMWLTGRLTPDFKTIADFRRDNGKGIRNVCRSFVVLCRQMKLFSQAVVAIDGSKFKAVNSRDRNFSPGKIDAYKEQIEQSIQRYLDALDTADRVQPADLEAKTDRLLEKIGKLRERMRQLDETKEQLTSEPGQRRSLTDPDSRSMLQSGKSTGLVGYNVQTAVEGKHHLIVDRRPVVAMKSGFGRANSESLSVHAASILSGARRLTSRTLLPGSPACRRINSETSIAAA